MYIPSLGWQDKNELKTGTVEFSDNLIWFLKIMDLLHITHGQFNIISEFLCSLFQCKGGLVETYDKELIVILCF